MLRTRIGLIGLAVLTLSKLAAIAKSRIRDLSGDFAKSAKLLSGLSFIRASSGVLETDARTVAGAPMLMLINLADARADARADHAARTHVPAQDSSKRDGVFASSGAC